LEFLQLQLLHASVGQAMIYCKQPTRGAYLHASAQINGAARRAVEPSAAKMYSEERSRWMLLDASSGDF
jgi:hypothetical protein